MSFKFPISERFLSLQGEGVSVGSPEYFVRLAGCNLASQYGGCSYCDTQYAQKKEQGEVLSLETLLQDALDSHKYPGRICLTGGEPLWHEGIIVLANRLLMGGSFVRIETNGSLPLPRMAPPHTCEDIAVHWGVSFSMDVKCPSSGMVAHNVLENVSQLLWFDQVKFVIGDRIDFEYAQEVLREYSCGAPTFFQASYGRLDPKELVEWLLTGRLDVRLSFQLHKTLWGIRRGV